MRLPLPHGPGASSLREAAKSSTHKTKSGQVRGWDPKESRDYPLCGARSQEASLPSLPSEPIFTHSHLHKASRGPRSPSSVSQEAGIWWAQYQGRGGSQLPLWQHYAIPGVVSRIEAMLWGLLVRSCHLVRWFVLSTT